MTGRTRDYLADLANKKGVTLPVGFENSSQAKASDMIEELKALPDAKFRGLSNSDRTETRASIERTIKEMNKWTFER